MITKNQVIRDLFPERNYLTFEQIGVITNSQSLWLELAYWIRSLMIAMLRDPERVEFNYSRLFSGVIQDFYSYFRSTYGAEIAEQIIKILSEYIINIYKLIDAIKNNNTEAVNQITKDIYETLDELAAFLNRVNIHWDMKHWSNLLYQFNRIIIEQIVAMAGEQFEREIGLVRRISDLTSVIGNYMARGLLAGYLI